jgi:hypothetical protein
MRSWLTGLESGRLARAPCRDAPERCVEDAPISSVWAFRAGLGLLLLGVASRMLVYFLSFPIWRDEAALALNFVSRDFRGLLNELDNFQVAPLFFLWIEKAIYQLAGQSVQLLRLVPVVAGVAALVLFWRLAQLCLEPLPAALAVGFMAVAQVPIHLASMIKPYSIDLFAAVLLLWLAIRSLRATQRSGWLSALALMTPFLLTTSYPAIFVAGSVSLVLLPVVWRHGERTNRILFVAFNLLCMATFAAHLRLVGREGHDPTLPTVETYMAGFWKMGLLPDKPLPTLRWLGHAHTGHLFSYPLEFNGGGLLGLLLILAGVYALYRQRRLSLLGLCLLPLAFNFAAAVLRRYPYGGDQRLEQHLVPGICLLLGSGAAEVLRRLPMTRRLGAAFLTGSFVLIGLAGTASDVLHPYHDVEAAWAADIAQHLRSEVHSQDRILFPHSERFTLNCLRWQLLPFGEQVCTTDAIDWMRLGQINGRLWLVDQRTEQAPAVHEPPVRDPLALSPLSLIANWHAIHRERFLVSEPNTGSPLLFHFCCDLHVLCREKSPI